MRIMNALFAAVILGSGAAPAFADILPGPRPPRPVERPITAPAKVTVTGAVANQIVNAAGNGRSLLVAECQKDEGAVDYTCTLSAQQTAASPGQSPVR